MTFQPRKHPVVKSLMTHLLRAKGTGRIEELPTYDGECNDVTNLRIVLQATTELIFKLAVEEATCR